MSTVQELIDYPALALRVKEVVEGTGASVDFIRNSEDPVDPAKPWRQYSTSLDDIVVTSWDGGLTEWDGGDTAWDTLGPPGSRVSAIAVADEYSVEELEENKNLRHGDKLYYVSASSVGADTDLRTYDAIIADGDRFEVVKVELIKPAAIPLLYIVQVRR